MEDTSRAFAVLAALVLALAPVTNGVLEKAANTAERVIFEPADWDREPPQDPPDVEPPEDLPEGNESFNGSMEGASPSCEVQTEPVALWDHTSDVEEQQMPPNRTTDGTTVSFEVNETHIGLGVALRIVNLTGELSASVHPAGDPDEDRFSYSHSALSGQQDPVNKSATISREELEEGEWEAQLSFQTANYDRLMFVVVRASCAGAGS